MEVNDLEEPKEQNPGIQVDDDFALCFRHKGDNIKPKPLANNKGVLLQRKR